MFSTTPPTHRLWFQLRAIAATLFVAALIGIAFPAQVQSQTSTSQRVSLEGIIEVLHEDRPQGGRYHYFLNTTNERVKLQVKGRLKEEHQTGDRVRVKGIKTGQILALDSGSGSVQPLVHVAPDTFGAQKTLVLLINFQDNTSQPYTKDFAADVVFNTTSNFHYENSYQQTWLEGEVHGWYTLPMSGATCDFNTMYFKAREAAAADGIDLSKFKRFIYAFPQTGSCGWWGLGTVGGAPSSHAWINGSLQLRVVAHETGHNLGLYHSHALECGSATIGGSCSSIEYGDTIDVMGGSTAHINTFQKEWLGWLNYGSSPPITTTNEDGVFSIDAYESLGSNSKAVKILKSTNPSTGYHDWYYVEYRQAIGFDSYLSTNSNVVSGVLIHTGSESTADSSYLLDLTPATSSWFDPALSVGQSFQDPESGLTITLMSADSSGASISVNYGSVTCVPGNPTVASSQKSAVPAGTTLTYTLTITNRDVNCGTSNFSVQALAPDGWTAVAASSSVSIASGASASVSLQVTSPASATDGLYVIGVTAVHSDNANYAGSGSASYTVSNAVGGSPENITVSTNSAVYPRKKPIPITAKVSSNGLAVKGAIVNLTVTKPDGNTVSATLTTRKNGTSVFKFRTTLLDPVGTYWVTADAGNAGPVSGLVTTSFVVQ